MYPVLFQWGGFFIPAWHFFYVAGAIVGYFVFLRGLGGGRSGVSEHEGSQLFAVCYITGYFGSRALSIAVEEPQNFTLANFLPALTSFGAMTFYGGAIAGFLCGLCFVIWKGLKFGEVFDAAIPAFLLALGFGRIGCFLNGDDYGVAIGGEASPVPWWSVTFPNLADGIARYPIQLWEAAFGLLAGILLFCGLKWVRRFLQPAGVGVLGTLAYAIFRFWNEYYRGDDRKWLIEGRVSTSQGISALIILLVIVTLPVWLRSPRSAVKAL